MFQNFQLVQVDGDVKMNGLSSSGGGSILVNTHLFRGDGLLQANGGMFKYVVSIKISYGLVPSHLDSEMYGANLILELQ